MWMNHKYLDLSKYHCSPLTLQVKNHMWLFVNCLIENPTFDSQTKENMTLQQKGFGSTCSLSAQFIKQVPIKTFSASTLGGLQRP